MGERRLVAALICLALLPSAWLAWTWRAMPQLGLYHDDAIYLVTAKSLAEGNGYRIASLPGGPYQTKYPPLYPALLAAVWRLDPSFPANLPNVMLLAWAGLVAFVFLTWRLLRAAGFSEWESGGLAAFAALSPAAVLFGLLAMSELWFGALLVASIMAAGRGQAGRAGLLGALAFLTRSAALPLLFTTPLTYLWRRDFRRAAVFFATMAPAVAGWQWWSLAHRAPSSQATLFYTDYFGFYLRDVTLAGLPELIFFNVNLAVKAIGELFIFDTDNGFGALTVSRVLTTALVSGCVRLARAGRLVHYGAFALGYTAQFLVWNYPPTQRFFLPLLPLLAAGGWRELQTLGATVAGGFRKRGAERVVALAMCGLVGFLGWQWARWSPDGLFTFFPQLFEQRRELLVHQREAHRWLDAHAGPGASLLSYHDPVEYLYTGRHGYSLRVPPGVLKRGDRDEIRRFFGDLPKLMAADGIRHVVLSGGDYHMDCPDLTVKAYRSVFKDTDLFEPVFERGDTAVYKVKTKWAYDRADDFTPLAPAPLARRGR